MERTVLKRRIKGLAAFMLAVMMMFGSSLSVLAASYSLKCDYNSGWVIENCTLTVGTIITSEDDITNSISCNYGLRCKIDEGAMREVGYGSSGGTIYFSDFLEEGKFYKVTAVDSIEDGGYLEITLQTIVDSGEEGGSTGEGGSGSTEESGSTEDTGNFESSEDTKVEEPEVEQPKESEVQIFYKELLARAATAKAGDNIVIDATKWHSFSGEILGELLSKEGVSYTLYYNYGGETFYISLPAGATLEEGCDWYGPFKLNAMFGRTMIDKTELDAAIDG